VGWTEERGAGGRINGAHSAPYKTDHTIYHLGIPFELKCSIAFDKTKILQNGRLDAQVLSNILN